MGGCCTLFNGMTKNRFDQMYSRRFRKNSRYIHDLRCGSPLMENSFLKAHKETYLNLEPIDGDCVFVIIDQENQLDEIKNDDERRLYLEESRSQETWNNGN